MREPGTAGGGFLMRVCILYDCLFPWTIGGAERWYRALAERLAAEGHSVTYLTLRQWERGKEPHIPGVAVVAVGPRLVQYDNGRRRRIWPPLRYGLGVFGHLLRHGREYDHVHGASFPFFSILAAGLIRPLHRYSLGVDWHEVWTREYWRQYLGAAGLLGWWVQAMCAKIPHKAFVFSELHRGRLASLGVDAIRLPGEYAGGSHPPAPAATPPTILYAGRLIPEKRVGLLIEAFAVAHSQMGELRLRIIGEGPEAPSLVRRIERLGRGDAVNISPFVSAADLEAGMAEATAIVQPSAREGYGMVVVEAAAHGVPVIVVQGEDNAATELVDAGENGLISSDIPSALAAAILAVCRDNAVSRATASAWYARNRERLSIESSFATLLEAIAD
jgi:glycosyltransferase involved in cell wall biosynthesis